MRIGGVVMNRFKCVYLFLDKFISTYLEMYHLKETIVLHLLFLYDELFRLALFGIDSILTILDKTF